jgi:hypothetical protein
MQVNKVAAVLISPRNTPEPAKQHKASKNSNILFNFFIFLLHRSNETLYGQPCSQAYDAARYQDRCYDGDLRSLSYIRKEMSHSAHAFILA